LAANTQHREVLATDWGVNSMKISASETVVPLLSIYKTN
jgi:hypothetical protein